MIPLSEWDKHHEWPSVATLRAWYADDTCGFRRAATLRAPGARGRRGRIVIDESAFFAWLRGQGAVGSDAA